MTEDPSTKQIILQTILTPEKCLDSHDRYYGDISYFNYHQPFRGLKKRVGEYQKLTGELPGTV